MRLTPLLASTFRSDGGTMFGLVPRALWEKKIQPDQRHTIPQHAHVFLVELADGRRGLVDTGCGSAERFEDRERALSGLGPGWPLLENLKALGVAPEDIAFVVFTHLHWDHGGGAVAPASWGRALTFPRARHYIHALEWQDATSGDPLLYKSYPPAITAALRTADLQLVKEDDAEILPGLRLLRTSGHTRGHCAVWFQPAGLHLVHPAVTPETPHHGFLLAGDVCPSQHNLRMVFQTSYDTYPLHTRAWKRTWLPRLSAERIGLLFDHDPDLLGAFIRPDPREEFAVETPLPFPAP
jgi:glyoxylase-like metal-dependent hydrolase (beta-lactamase superfamily II)